MSIPDYRLPDSTDPTFGIGEPYQVAIDGAAAVHAAIAGQFVVQENAPADLQVRVLPGARQFGGVEVARGEQLVSLAPAPTTDPRIDLIVIDRLTLVASAVTGTEAALPVEPALPANTERVAAVSLAVGQTEVLNGHISDRRTPSIPHAPAVGSFTRALNAPSGSQAIVVGAGYRPRAVIFFAGETNVPSSQSWGMDDGVAARASRDQHLTTSNAWAQVSGQSIQIVNAGGTIYEGHVVSFDVDGFTIAWTRTGAPVGTLTGNYIVFP